MNLDRALIVSSTSVVEALRGLVMEERMEELRVKLAREKKVGGVLMEEEVAQKMQVVMADSPVVQ